MDTTDSSLIKKTSLFLIIFQGYLVAKLHEEDVSFEEWKGDDDTPSKCSDHFTLTNQYYIDIAASVIKSRTLHKIRNWKDVAWAKSNFHCDVRKFAH